MNIKEFKLNKELEDLRHSNKMEEIEFETSSKRKLQAVKHDHELETHRIKNADIQRSIARRDQRR